MRNSRSNIPMLAVAAVLTTAILAHAQNVVYKPYIQSGEAGGARYASLGGKPNRRQTELVQATIARLPEVAEIVAAFRIAPGLKPAPAGAAETRA
jgi:hypothetical protein